MKHRIKLLLIVALGVSITSEAHAWVWFSLRAGATRSAATTGARAAAAESTALRGVGGAARATANINPVVRYCVRQKSAQQCDFHFESSAYDAAAKAVGPRNRIFPTGDAGVFQVIDAAGTIIDIIEALSEEMDPSTARLPQYNNENQPTSSSNNNSSRSSSSGSNAPKIPDAPQEQQRSRVAREVIWQYDLNYSAHTIWSDGAVVVWADGDERRYSLNPQQRITIANARTLFVSPQSDQATGMSLIPVMESQPRQQQNSRPNGIFPYGSNVACPQIPIGNGMARCQ